MKQNIWMCNGAYMLYTSCLFPISGLYTDTHVLALMYGGEMSLWYHKALEEKIFTENNTQPFNAHATALSLLRAYLEAVNGPLIGKGWATERAEEILEEL